MCAFASSHLRVGSKVPDEDQPKMNTSGLNIDMHTDTLAARIWANVDRPNCPNTPEGLAAPGTAGKWTFFSGAQDPSKWTSYP